MCIYPYPSYAHASYDVMSTERIKTVAEKYLEWNEAQNSSDERTPTTAYDDKDVAATTLT